MADFAFVAEAAGEADAVEVFEELDAAFAAELDAVAEGGGADYAALRFQLQYMPRELANGELGVEQIFHHLLQQAETGELA